MKKLGLVFLLAANVIFCQAQYLTGIATKWSDSFVEWTVFTENEEGEGEEGELKMRWQMRNDWTEWDYRIGEQFGTIKIKWSDNPNEWEIVGDGERLLARTIWRGNFREWRITGGDHRMTLKTRWGNQFDEWILGDDSAGNFQIYTAWEGDPREWVIVDELNEEVSLPLKMGLTFLAVFHSSPKE